MPDLLNMYPEVLCVMGFMTEVHPARKVKLYWCLNESRFDPKFICPSKNAVHLKYPFSSGFE